MKKALIFCVIVSMMVVSGTAFAEILDNVFYAGIAPNFGMGLFGGPFVPAPPDAKDDMYLDGMGGRLNVGVFFGYAITEYFAMEIEPYFSMFMGSTDYISGVTEVGAFINGRLLPRKAFREADYKLVQPFLLLGFGVGSTSWTYDGTSSMKNNQYFTDLADTSSGLTMAIKFQVGVDFYLTEPGVGSHILGVYLGPTIPLGAGLDQNSNGYLYGAGEVQFGVDYRYQW